MDAVIRGIKRRRRSEKQRDGTVYAVDYLLELNDLPGVNSDRGGFDPSYISFLYDLAELVERHDDAAEADQTAEAAFIMRQIKAAIARAKIEFSGPFSRPALRVPRTD
jgi:hypothetical protein